MQTCSSCISKMPGYPCGTTTVSLVLQTGAAESDQTLEISNNGYRDGSSALNNTEDSFLKIGGMSVEQRKMNAVRAYFEWMP
jgi:hypothetical protein